MVVLLVAACGRQAQGGPAPNPANLFSGRLALKDVTPILGDAKNWWDAEPTFDIRPLNSISRGDEDLGGLTIRFTHLGTAELLSLNYDVLSSTTIATDLMGVNKLLDGNGVTGPKAGDEVLYYNRKIPAAPAPYDNVAFVRVGQTVISINWFRIEGFARANTFGELASMAAKHFKDGLAGKVKTSPVAAITDPLLLPPPNTQLTLLGATRLPIEVLAQMITIATPVVVADEFHQNGVKDFVFGDYALNADTHQEVVTAGFSFDRFPTGGEQWVTQHFGVLTATGEAGGYSPALGAYIFSFGTGPRAVVVICKSATEGEAAARSCEAPMAAILPAWHALLGAA